MNTFVWNIIQFELENENLDHQTLILFDFPNKTRASFENLD